MCLAHRTLPLIYDLCTSKNHASCVPSLLALSTLLSHSPPHSLVLINSDGRSLPPEPPPSPMSEPPIASNPSSTARDNLDHNPFSTAQATRVIIHSSNDESTQGTSFNAKDLPSLPHYFEGGAPLLPPHQIHDDAR